MTNTYEIAEVVEIGRAQDVILGTSKVNQVVDDSPHQILRDPDMSEDD